MHEWIAIYLYIFSVPLAAALCISENTKSTKLVKAAIIATAILWPIASPLASLIVTYRWRRDARRSRMNNKPA